MCGAVPAIRRHPVGVSRPYGNAKLPSRAADSQVLDYEFRMSGQAETIISSACEARDAVAGSPALFVPFFRDEDGGNGARWSHVGASAGDARFRTAAVDPVVEHTEAEAAALFEDVLRGTGERGGLEGLTLSDAYSYTRSEEYALRRQTARSIARLLGPEFPAAELAEMAAAVRDSAWGRTASFSPKVFVDLTRLCRDRCSYCTFVRSPLSVRIRSPRSSSLPAGEGSLDGEEGGPGGSLGRRPGAETKGRAPYLLADEILERCEQAKEVGCTEALFTLGDRPETRYVQARRFLEARGFGSTPEYLSHCAGLVLEELGILPHLNPGVMTFEELLSYRRVAPSVGMMLESTSWWLYAHPSGCHYGSLDKHPAVRMAVLEAAGAARAPMTTGVLVGIGETLEERADSLLTIAAMSRRWGNIQEVIVQNFRAKSSTPMRGAPEPQFEELARAVAVARVLLPPSVAVQAPPNLTPVGYGRLLEWGLSDWGGISPVTPDFVNPEAPWPSVVALAEESKRYGFELRPRLCIYPAFVREGGWLDESVRAAVSALCDDDGWGVPRGPLAHAFGGSQDDASVDRSVVAGTLSGARSRGSERTRAGA